MEENQIQSLDDISYWDQKGRWVKCTSLNFERELSQQWKILKRALSGSSPTELTDRDRRIRGPKYYNYTVKEIYFQQSTDGNTFSRNEIWNIIWRSDVIPKIMLFIWITCHNKILTYDNL